MFQREGDLREILTFNSHTVHIPSVEVLSFRSSSQDNLFTSADNRIFTFWRSNCDFDVSQLLVNHVNRDSVNNFTILVSSSSSGHIVGRGSIRLNGKRRTHIIINRPLVSNNLRVETIEISIQHNGSAGAHILSGSGDLEVSTQLIDGELSGSLASTKNISCNSSQGVMARHNGVQSISMIFSSTFFGKTVRSRPSIAIEFASSGKRVGLLTSANHVVTHDSKCRNSVNRNGSSGQRGKVNLNSDRNSIFIRFTFRIKRFIYAKCVCDSSNYQVIFVNRNGIGIITRTRDSGGFRACTRVATILVDRHHSVGVSTRLIQVHRNSIQVLSRNLNAVLEPNVGKIGGGGNGRKCGLLAGTDNRIRSTGNRNLRRKRMHRNINRSGHLADIIITSINRHSIMMSFNSGSDKHRSCSSGSINITPIVGNFHVFITRGGNSQGNILTIANFHLVGSQSNRASRLINGEVSGSRATIVVRSGSRVNTGGSGGVSSSIILTGLASRTNPSNLRITIARNHRSGQRGACTVTNHVITGNGKFGSSVDERLNGSNRRGSRTAHIVSRFCGNNVLTQPRQIHVERGTVLTVNFLTIVIPNNAGCITRESSGHQTTLTNIFGTCSHSGNRLRTT